LYQAFAMASTSTNGSRVSRVSCVSRAVDFEENFMGANLPVNSSSTLPPATGAEAPTTVEETTGATHAGTPKAQAKGNSNGGHQKRYVVFVNGHIRSQPQGVGKKVAQEGAAAPAPTTVEETTGATHAGTPKAQAKGNSNGGRRPGANMCRNGHKCFALIRGFCRYFHTEDEKAAASAVVACPPSKPCEKGTKENCDRYMQDHTGNHVCKKHHADTLNGVEGIFLSPNTWQSNHVKYVDALAAAEAAEAEAKAAEAKVERLKAEADAVHAQAGWTVNAIGQRLMQAEATLASFGIVPFLTGCYYCQQGRCDGRNHQ
jgi:hypothetical protein